MVVLHGDALVLVMTLKMVGTIGRDVDQGSDAQGIQHVLAGSMIGAAQVQKGQDLHWATLKFGNIQHLSRFAQSQCRSPHPQKLCWKSQLQIPPGQLLSTVVVV